MRAIEIDGVVGWLHDAAGGRGVVIVGAFGYEELCSRRTLKLLADHLARAGLPTLRIDPRDTGDSIDLPEGADRVAAWTDDVVRAARWMRRETGVSELVLVGLRLGALLAAAAAMELGDVERLVLLAPPSSGRAHARELAILSRIFPPDPSASTEGLTIAGFHLADATLAALTAIDLEKATSAPAPHVTLVGDLDSIGLARLARALTAQNATVELAPFDGYARMMCDPTASEPAMETIARVVELLGRDLPATGSRCPDLPSARLETADWIEEPQVFAHDLVGVLCRPSGPRPAARAAIWFNAGRNPHGGWARMTVDLSRRLARAGVAVLRIDFVGIGDSGSCPSSEVSALYGENHGLDVTAAIDLMAAQGWNRVTLIGMCSGGHHVFHAAADESRIDGLVLINLLCFIWDESYARHLSTWMAGRAQSFTNEVAEAERVPESETPLARVRRGLRRLRRLAGATRNHARRMLAAALADRRDPVVRRLREFSARGLWVSLVMSEGDQSVEELEKHAGSGAARVRNLPGLRILTIPDADHTLTPSTARERLGDHLLERLSTDAAPQR